MRGLGAGRRERGTWERGTQEGPSFRLRGFPPAAKKKSRRQAHVGLSAAFFAFKRKPPLPRGTRWGLPPVVFCQVELSKKGTGIAWGAHAKCATFLSACPSFMRARLSRYDLPRNCRSLLKKQWPSRPLLTEHQHLCRAGFSPDAEARRQRAGPDGAAAGRCCARGPPGSYPPHVDLPVRATAPTAPWRGCRPPAIAGVQRVGLWRRASTEMSTGWAKAADGRRGFSGGLLAWDLCSCRVLWWASLRKGDF